MARRRKPVNDHDFELFRIAFNYVQQHRFARIKDSVSTLHLVGEDQRLHPEFRAMVLRVFQAVKQAYQAVEELEG